MRRPHYLPPNKANQLPSQCIWFDTETKGEALPNGDERHSLWFGYAAFRRRKESLHWCKPEWLRFDDIGAFWDWVESHCRRKVRTYLFCHNGGFDLLVMDAFAQMRRRGWSLTSAIVEAPPMVLTWKRDGMTLRFVDTLNLWRVPLQKLGESVGLDKLTMPEPNAPQKDWEAYGKRDTEVIMKACLEWFTFLRDNDLGGFCPTLASQAFGTFRHRFMDTGIFIDDKPEALELARDAYLGGRCECFKLGEYHGNFHHLDINSMYPAVMLSEIYPTQLIGVYRSGDIERLTDWLDKFCIIASVCIETRTPSYPVVHDGKLCFPTGRFRCTLATPELKLALSKGHIKRVGAMAVYRRGRPFQSFVEFFYGERLKAKHAGNEIAAWYLKIMANSLYGKFGQRGRRYESSGSVDTDEVKVWSTIHAQTGKITRMRQFGGLVQEWVDEGESSHSHPAIAAHVTSHARLRLWEVIALAGRKNVFYCDTDCIVTNDEGRARVEGLLDPDKLGALKVEKTFKRMELYGAKDYEFGALKRTKGVRANAEWIDDATVVQDRFVGFRGVLRSGDLTAPIIQRGRKHLSRTYDKGRPQADGRVLPLYLTDW